MQTATITLNIAEIKHQRGGSLIIFIFTGDGFPKRHEMAQLKFSYPVIESSASVEIQVPLEQSFAIKVLHDENGDGQVTKNWTGIIPHDGLGFSNGARIRFGPPSFDDARIHYKYDLTPTITLQYF